MFNLNRIAGFILRYVLRQKFSGNLTIAEWPPNDTGILKSLHPVKKRSLKILPGRLALLILKIPSSFTRVTRTQVQQRHTFIGFKYIARCFLYLFLLTLLLHSRPFCIKPNFHSLIFSCFRFYFILRILCLDVVFPILG